MALKRIIIELINELHNVYNISSEEIEEILKQA